MTADPTVFVVDDDPAVRSSLEWLIGSIGLKVDTFETAEDFLSGLDPERPGCLVLDLRMPGIGGLELQQELARRGIPLPIIIISGHADVSTAVQAIKAGAVELLEKPFSDQALLDHINRAIELDRRWREIRARRDEISRHFELLTPREREVLAEILAGHANKVIAYDLGISERTVEVHRARVMRKMTCGSLAELVRMCIALEESKTWPSASGSSGT